MLPTTTADGTRAWAHLIDAVLATPPDQAASTVIDGELALARALADWNVNPYPRNYQGMARQLLIRMATYLATGPPQF